MVSPKPSYLGIGLRAGIISSAINSGFIEPVMNNEYSDAELLKHTCKEGNQEWFDWLLKNGNIYGTKRSIKVIPKKLLDLSVVLAVEGEHYELASRLFKMGARMKTGIDSALYSAICRGHYDMAELLFANGGAIKQDIRLKECIHSADDRMKAIIKKGMIESINKKFSS